MASPTLDECRKAKEFRKSLGMTLNDMSGLTGFTRQACHYFERSKGARGTPINEFAWQRYKMCCLAVAILKKYGIEDISRWQWK